MKIYLIGIGGIGVSALAQYYLSKGHLVYGSDLVVSDITKFLETKGVKMSAPELPDLVVYSPAVKQDNAELKKYREQGTKCLSYPEALGEITKEYYTIAVAGAHGKSTTTAMIALILMKAGFDPTVIVGTKLKEFSAQGGLASGEGTNFRAGKSKFLVIEACEYEDSFLNYFPKIAVITNIDKEHLDYFKTFANVKKSFKSFAERLPKDGFLVKSKKMPESKKIKKILQVPGEHNVFNAQNALQVARILKIKDSTSFLALSDFTGTWRRFEQHGQVISDYGHHPNEVLATLKAVREKYPNKKIWCVFQPHQYQRTYYLFDDFVKVFRKVKIDNIIITDIYDVAGRETKEIKREVSSEGLVKKINKKNVAYVPTLELENYIKKNLKSEDVLIIMGAGDIYKLADKF